MTTRTVAQITAEILRLQEELKLVQDVTEDRILRLQGELKLLEKPTHYVIYDKSTKQTKGTRKTKAAAVITVNALNRKVQKGSKREWAYCTPAEYHKINGFVVVKNLLSGKDVMIRESEAGGCCDPSTETYHSM
jgi:hypothetical protein